MLLVGHLVVSEQNPFRKFLLYILARYFELPLLRYSHQAIHGPNRDFFQRKAVKYFLKRFLLHPVGSHIDTGHPMLLEEVLNLLDQQDLDVAVGPCRCRHAHQQCDHPIETDIVIRTGTEAFLRAFPDDYRRIDKDEAKDIVRSCAEKGMWHMVFVHCPTEKGMNEYVVCNCCVCGCVPFMLNKAFGQSGFPLLRGEHLAQIITAKCRGCGECLDVCPWEARSLTETVVAVDAELCFGCGLCERACKNGAVKMVKERPQLPLRTYHEHSHHRRS